MSAIITTNNNTQQLSKEQIIFDKKLALIKQLKFELKELSDQLPQAIAKYNAVFNSFSGEFLKVRIDKIKALDLYFDKIYMTKADQSMIQEYMIDQIFRLLDINENKDPILIFIFEKYAQESFESFTNKFKFKENVSNVIDPEYDINKKNVESEYEFNDDFQEKDDHKKSKKEYKKLEKQKAKDDLRKKSIRSIYIDLIKIFHPDTEIDPIKKIEKEEISKKITIAYNQKDLFGLLKIEIDNLELTRNSHKIQSETKLKMFNEILENQRIELSQKMEQLIYSNKHIYENMCKKNSNPDKYIKLVKNEFKTQIKNIKIQIDHLEIEWKDKYLKKIILSSIEEELEFS